MVAVDTIAAFDLVAGSIAAIGLFYLLYSGTMVVHYRRFFRLITMGLLLYAITGPIVGVLAPEYVHAIHGIAVLFIALGLYDLVRDDIRPERDIDAFLAVTVDESDGDLERPEDADGSPGG